MNGNDILGIAALIITISLIGYFDAKEAMCCSAAPRAIRGGRKKMQNAQVLEDNSGGIHWATADGRSCSTIGVAKSSSNVGMLVADLVALENWIDDVRHDRPDEADTVEMDEAGMKVIAEIDDDGVVTIYTYRMGVSGRIYAGVEEK